MAGLRLLGRLTQSLVSMNDLLKKRMQRRLEEITAELSQIDHRLAVAHGLGDSNSTQGISQTYSDNKYWTSRRDALRRERDTLEARLAGEIAPQSPYINQGVFRPL